MKHPNKLRQYRLLKGLSAKQVANYMGLKNEETIIRWERGETMPRTGLQAMKLVIIYNVLLEQLFPMQFLEAKKVIAANAKKHGIKLRKIS